MKLFKTKKPSGTIHIDHGRFLLLWGQVLRGWCFFGVVWLGEVRDSFPQATYVFGIENIFVFTSHILKEFIKYFLLVRNKERIN